MTVGICLLALKVQNEKCSCAHSFFDNTNFRKSVEQYFTLLNFEFTTIENVKPPFLDNTDICVNGLINTDQW